jgi:hypothetical protein
MSLLYFFTQTKKFTLLNRHAALLQLQSRVFSTKKSGGDDSGTPNQDDGSAFFLDETFVDAEIAKEMKKRGTTRFVCWCFFSPY